MNDSYDDYVSNVFQCLFVSCNVNNKVIISTILKVDKENYHLFEKADK